MPEYFKTQIARIFNMDIRTFNRRAKEAGLKRTMPRLFKHKAVFDEQDLEKIETLLGKPAKIKRYIFYQKGGKKAVSRVVKAGS